MQNADKPVYPIGDLLKLVSDPNPQTQAVIVNFTGITKRELIAIHALTGLLSRGAGFEISAQHAVKAAEALLAELEKSG